MEISPIVEYTLKQSTASEFGIQPQALQITEVNPTGWSDGCLDLGEEGEYCTMALVSGWIVTLTDGQHRWVYHVAGVHSFRLNRLASDVPGNIPKR